MSLNNCESFVREQEQVLGVSHDRMLNVWDDETLALAVQLDFFRGDAFEILYRRYWPKMVGWLCSRKMHVADAEDRAANIWRKLVRFLHEGRAWFDPARGTYAGCLYRITINGWKDFLRGQRKPTGPTKLSEELMDSCLPPEEMALFHELNGQLDAALAQLSPEYREVIRAVLDGERPAAIADRLGQPVQAVYNRLFRARARLKDLLHEYLGPGPPGP